MGEIGTAQYIVSYQNWYMTIGSKISVHRSRGWTNFFLVREALESRIRILSFPSSTFIQCSGLHDICEYFLNFGETVLMGCPKTILEQFDDMETT